MTRSLGWFLIGLTAWFLYDIEAGNFRSWENGMDLDSAPVAALFTLGRPSGHLGDDFEPNYTIDREHVPELVRIVQDRQLFFGPEPGCYALIHAWRALAQLRAEEAIEPLLDLIAWNAAQEKDWSDWICEELPVALAMIGPRVLPPVVERLERSRAPGRSGADYGKVLSHLAQRHPETRAEAVAGLSRVLEQARDYPPEVNGFIISDLMDLKAVEAWPAIDRAFATGNVDESIAGGAVEVKYEMGLGPKPPERAPFGHFRPHKGMNSKQRFEERMRKKKAEKKNRKAARKKN